MGDSLSDPLLHGSHEQLPQRETTTTLLLEDITRAVGVNLRKEALISPPACQLAPTSQSKILFWHFGREKLDDTTKQGRLKSA